jgi:hypothetical protein
MKEAKTIISFPNNTFLLSLGSIQFPLSHLFADFTSKQS